VLDGIKSGCRSWLWSTGVLARSPFYVLVLATFLGAWSAGAYEWLWLPESSVLILLLGFIWMLALALTAVAVLAAMTASTLAVAAGVEQRLCLPTGLRFGRRRFGWALAIVVVAFVLALAGVFFFGWLNDHALDVASFLSLHLRKPVSYMLVGKIFWTLEALVWIALGGVLMSWLLVLSSASRKREEQARTPRGVIFLTGLLDAAVFGGLAWLVATWHPLVKPGFWDYMQLIIRIGAVLFLGSLGWLFWTLSLARIGLQPVTGQAASPTPY
jgi:hypothetical protein